MTDLHEPATVTVVDYPLLIADGKPRTDREWIERRNPANGDLVSRYVRGLEDDTIDAIALARTAFDDGVWTSLTGGERGRIMLDWVRLIRRDKERLARLEMLEVGKSLSAALDDIETTAGLTEHAAMQASSVHGEYFDNLGHEIGIAAREPVGVVGAITAWNFPAVIYASKVPFALAAGCTVVAKPSELASATCLEISLLAYEAGLPRAALSVVTGYGAEAGQPLADSTDVDLLSFTGSTSTANVLAQTPRPFPQKLSLELGGKGATIVFADANLDEAIDGTLKGFVHNQGQICTAGTRLLVERSIAEDFVDRLASRIASFTLGDPADGADVGPLIDARQAVRVREFLDAARSDGARIVPDVPADPTLPDTFVHPALVLDLDHSNAIFQQEIFGPVLAVATFDTVEEAISLANGTTYGLANGVWTTHVSTAFTVARKLRSGIVWINNILTSPHPLPFGGAKASGYGREKGADGVNEFTQLKMITLELEERDFFYPTA